MLLPVAVAHAVACCRCLHVSEDMGGDEMFDQCLDQQPGLKAWMTHNSIADYNALQQYFTKRLRSEVLPQLTPQPPIVVWEENDGLAISSSSLGPNDIGQVYGSDSSGFRTIVEGGTYATFSPSAWYMPGTSDATKWEDVYAYRLRVVQMSCLWNKPSTKVGPDLRGCAGTTRTIPRQLT